jgi:hypothetical protein
MDDTEPKRQLTLVLDSDDLGLLNKLSATEKLNKSDVLRRALRAYAKSLLPQSQEVPESKVA